MQNSVQSSLVGDMQAFFKDSTGHYVVLFSFVAREENDLTVERGQIITVLNKDDSNWFWVMRHDAHEGFVPSIYICQLDTLISK